MAVKRRAKLSVSGRSRGAMSRRTATHGGSNKSRESYTTRKGAAILRNAKKKKVTGENLVSLSTPKKKKITGSMLVSTTRASKGTAGRRGRAKLRKRR